MTSRAERIPAPLLVLAGIISVQFGGALAQTLIPVIGAGGSVVMRLLFATAILYAGLRPRRGGHSRSDWITVIAFGLSLGLMNFTFYSSLAHLPIGVAVTIEFIGPLTLAAVLSRRWTDAVAVAAAAGGVLLMSGVFHEHLDTLPWEGILLALAAGALWAHTSSLAGEPARSSSGSTGWCGPWSSRPWSRCLLAWPASPPGRQQPW